MSLTPADARLLRLAGIIARASSTTPLDVAECLTTYADEVCALLSPDCVDKSVDKAFTEDAPRYQ